MVCCSISDISRPAASPLLPALQDCDRPTVSGSPRRKIRRVPPSAGAPTVWIHAASVGEVNLAKPIVARLKKTRPELKVHVSVNTMAGRENAGKAFPEATVSYFPLDLGGSVKRALRRIKPVGVILIELEVWPNFVRRCAKDGVPVVVVNGRMSERSYGRYRSWAGSSGRSSGSSRRSVSRTTRTRNG